MRECDTRRGKRCGEPQRRAARLLHPLAERGAKLAGVGSEVP